MTSGWRERWEAKVNTPEDMVAYIDDVGCCTAQELPRFPGLPNQREAVAPGAPDVWFWKDDLHAEKRLYYTRVIGGQTGFLSMRMLPLFVASCGKVVDELEVEGRLPVDTRQVYLAIAEQGPLPIRKLKSMLTPDALKSLDRSLVHLERHFIITKTGITGRTRTDYGYIWDLTERWMPDVLEAADAVGAARATRQLRDLLSTYGIPPDSPFYRKLLNWPK